ncbi:hypothetical protein [Bradyrhizobium cosmicum]|nr:hypothetical protein [Bradyrhizobium cosmicum]
MDMAVATGGVIAAGVVITTVGAEAEAITTAGATTAGNEIPLGVGDRL